MAMEEPNKSQREPEFIIEGERINPPLITNTRCGCFCLPCFGSRRPAFTGLALWERIRSGHDRDEDQWWSRGITAVKKLREWSEIVAGPRWKTFIRQFNRNRSGGVRHGKFQYDPLSYALNFDDGSLHNGDFDDEDNDYGAFRNFSARFASAPVPMKSAATVPVKEVEVLG